jgi:hypothetical protein
VFLVSFAHDSLHILLFLSNTVKMSELKDRSQFTLDTPSGYYDQIVGMSQGIINKSFKTMFDQVKGIAKIGIDARDKGSLDCVLDAPSILIIGNTSSTAEIYYQLKYESTPQN